MNGHLVIEIGSQWLQGKVGTSASIESLWLTDDAEDLSVVVVVSRDLIRRKVGGNVSA